MSSHAFSLTHAARIARAGSPARASTDYLVNDINARLTGDKRRISPLTPVDAHGRLLHEVLHDNHAQSELQTFTMRLSGQLIASAGIAPIAYTDSLAPFAPEALASFYVSTERDDRATLLRHFMTVTLGHAYPRTLSMQAGVWASVEAQDVTALRAYELFGFERVTEVVDPVSGNASLNMIVSSEHLSGLHLPPPRVI
jgi:hypothetical protein